MIYQVNEKINLICGTSLNVKCLESNIIFIKINSFVYMLNGLFASVPFKIYVNLCEVNTEQAVKCKYMNMFGVQRNVISEEQGTADLYDMSPLKSF